MASIEDVRTPGGNFGCPSFATAARVKARYAVLDGLAASGCRCGHGCRRLRHRPGHDWSGACLRLPSQFTALPGAWSYSAHVAGLYGDTSR